MARQARVLVDGGIYHIVQRGHNKGILFNNANDYKVFKDFIRKYKEKYVFDIFHYCIMSNHFHILLKIHHGDDLPKIVHGITQSYSYYYRKTYHRIGYVYQNRYKSFLVEDDAYLLECGRYIERNPLRACMVKDISDHYWSSYNFYAKGTPDDIITENPFYKDTGRTSEEKQKRYRDYVLEARPYEKIVDKAMLS
jgi:putative transposase